MQGEQSKFRAARLPVNQEGAIKKRGLSRARQAGRTNQPEFFTARVPCLAVRRERCALDTSPPVLRILFADIKQRPAGQPDAARKCRLGGRRFGSCCELATFLRAPSRTDCGPKGRGRVCETAETAALPGCLGESGDSSNRGRDVRAARELSACAGPSAAAPACRFAR